VNSWISAVVHRLLGFDMHDDDRGARRPDERFVFWRFSYATSCALTVRGWLCLRTSDSGAEETENSKIFGELLGVFFYFSGLLFLELLIFTIDPIMLISGFFVSCEPAPDA
jgi:hypothetical protein